MPLTQPKVGCWVGAIKHPAAPCPARYKHTTCGVVVEASLAGRRAGLAMSAWRVPRDESGTIDPMRGVARALTFVAALRR